MCTTYSVYDFFFVFREGKEQPQIVKQQRGRGMKKVDIKS